MNTSLQIDFVNVKIVQFGRYTKLENGRLTLNKDELIGLVNKSVFKSFDIQIAAPGEKCRIAGIVDIMQPRCKADNIEESYPGAWGKLAPAGQGRTVALRGVVVTELSYRKNNVKFYLDMCEPCAKYSYFSRHFHVIIDAEPMPGVSDLSYAEAVKHAALTINVNLAKLAVCQRPDRTLRFPNQRMGGAAKDLPRAAYLCVQLAHFDLWNFLYYGQSALGYLPMVIEPTELLDGAVINRYWEFTYTLQNEPYIMELMERHGKDLNFVGMVAANNAMRIEDKNANMMMAALLCKNTLRADCVMINKSGMGHSQLDAAMAFNWCEKLGMPAALNLAGISGKGTESMLVINDPRIDAIVNSGGGYILSHPRVDRLIGENTQVPCLIGLDPWGPFEHTSNCAYAGLAGERGDHFLTTDTDIDWTSSAPAKPL